MVWGVGGAAGRLAEATIFFWGVLSASADVIVASAAFRFLVMGGIVTVVSGQAASLQVDDGALADEIVMQHAKRGPCDGTRWALVHAGSVGREGREPGEDGALLRVQGVVGRRRARV